MISHKSFFCFNCGDIKDIYAIELINYLNSETPILKVCGFCKGVYKKEHESATTEQPEPETATTEQPEPEPATTEQPEEKKEYKIITTKIKQEPEKKPAKAQVKIISITPTPHNTPKQKTKKLKKIERRKKNIKKKVNIIHTPKINIPIPKIQTLIDCKTLNGFHRHKH